MIFISPSTEKEFCICETRKHQELVRYFLRKAVSDLLQRAEGHDQSKLEKYELDGFVEYTPKLRGTTYGSDEYKIYLQEMKPFLDHHYQENRHHPEHFKDGINGMNLIDILEMFCDWLAATKRHADGDIIKSIEINKGRFSYGYTLAEIFKNTAECLK
jgi:hypothetical protein